MHYARKLKYGDVHFTKTIPWGETTAFVAAAIQSETDDCILWPYGKLKAGYGRFQVDGVSYNAHRYICEAVYGAPDKGIYAAHKCGVRACINPRHLYWATPAQNSADKYLHNTYQRGERHGQSILTESDVREILKLKEKVSQRILAERYGVTQSTISDVHTGRTWGWMSSPD
jgi:hypothetical protein